MGQSSFPDVSALVTCNLCTRRSPKLEKASSELEEASSEIREAFAFPDVLTPVTYTLSFAKIKGSFSKRRFQISKRHQLYPNVSASVTYTLSLAKITGNLSKISGDVESTTRRKRAISQHLVSIFRSGTDCLEPLPYCLPSPALEYSSSTSYASSSSTTSAWGTDKGSENDTSKHKKQAEKNADCTIKST
ncbi:hypothetical protein ACFX1X_023166 [Malus domestica]